MDLISLADNLSGWLFEVFVTFTGGKDNMFPVLTSMWDAGQCQYDIPWLSGSNSLYYAFCILPSLQEVSLGENACSQKYRKLNRTEHAHIQRSNWA